MAMKLIKKTAEYKIFMRGDERYAVQDASGRPINGEEKVKILVAEDLVKVAIPSPKEEAPEAEAEGNEAEVAADDAPAAEESDATAELSLIHI